jgi:hypothetical protein
VTEANVDVIQQVTPVDNRKISDIGDNEFAVER